MTDFWTDDESLPLTGATIATVQSWLTATFPGIQERLEPGPTWMDGDRIRDNAYEVLIHLGEMKGLPAEYGQALYALTDFEPSLNAPVAYAELPERVALQGHELHISNGALAVAIALLRIGGELVEVRDANGTECVHRFYPKARRIPVPELTKIIGVRLQNAFPCADFSINGLPDRWGEGVVQILWKDADSVDDVRRIITDYRGMEGNGDKSRPRRLLSFLYQDCSARVALKLSRLAPRLPWHEVPKDAELVEFGGVRVKIEDSSRGKINTKRHSKSKTNDILRRRNSVR